MLECALIGAVNPDGTTGGRRITVSSLQEFDSLHWTIRSEKLILLIGQEVEKASLLADNSGLPKRKKKERTRSSLRRIGAVPWN